MNLPYDPSQVDELAIEFVLNGTRMRLNHDTTLALVLRTFDTWTPTELAVRLGFTTEHAENLRQTIRRYLRDAQLSA